MKNGFIVNVDGIPLTRSTFLRLQKLGRKLGLSEEAVIGYAAERFMAEHGELELKVDAAKRTAAAHREDRDGD